MAQSSERKIELYLTGEPATNREGNSTLLTQAAVDLRYRIE